MISADASFAYPYLSCSPCASISRNLAPRLITKAMAADMKPGSVIVDLAGETGGNCELSKTNESVIENFVRKEYDFEAAKCEHTTSSILLNKFYKNMKSLFNKDLFARVRTTDEIVINSDTVDTTFFYYNSIIGFYLIFRIIELK